jgi:hypothetical protein
LGGFQKTATRARPGTVLLSSSSRFPPSGEVIMLMLVMLPPGRARLATSPVSTGSAAMPPMTIGIVLVACLAAKLAGVPEARMSCTFMATSSAASAGSRSLRSSEKRYSITMFWPST